MKTVNIEIFHMLFAMHLLR